jgi:hypothetical protein
MNRKEKHKMLKLSFPVKVLQPHAVYEMSGKLLGKEDCFLVLH